MNQLYFGHHSGRQGLAIYVDTVEAPVSGHPREGEKVSQSTGVGLLYELESKRGFVKAAASRAVRLRECPFRER